MGSIFQKGLLQRLPGLFCLFACLVPAFAGTSRSVSSTTHFNNMEAFPTVRTKEMAAMSGTLLPVSAGELVISEFRLRGPNGANDEFIEIYNTSASFHIVVASVGTGYGIAASDGALRCQIPNGTVIPGHGHFLCTNSVGYSLGTYPAGNGTTATGDDNYVTDIPDNAGIALFSTDIPASFSVTTVIDAVGSTSEANTLYKEGTGYPSLTPFSINYAFVRDNCGKHGGITVPGPCTSGGLPIDTNNNANDFYFVDTNGTSAGAGQRLGAPGPENLSAPIISGSMAVTQIDSTQAVTLPPNRVRDFTSVPATNSTFGTLDIRRRFVNTTGGNVTRLRFRVIDITTFPAPSGIADLRPISSSDVVVSGINDAGTCGASPIPCSITVRGTVLEQGGSTQPNGGGFNSSMSPSTITLATPLAVGDSISTRFLLGIQQNGAFRFLVTIEALP